MIEQEPEYGNVRVLVADAAGSRLAQLLAPLDVPVEVAEPAALLQRIRRRKPDLVLLNLDAGVDAVAVLRAVRRDQAIDNMPVLVVGGREHEARAQAALAAGADDFLVQPVSPGVLLERMRYALAVAELIRRIASVRAEVRAARDAERHARDERDGMRSEAQRAAELERMKRDFLGLAAHELRAHLALVRGRLASVEQGAPAGGEASDPIDIANAVAPLRRVLARTTRLVDAMAVTADLEETSPDMGVGVVDLQEVVRAAIDDVTPPGKDGASVAMAPIDRPFFVAVDEQLIRDVIASIVENALLAADAGGTVRVSLGMNPSAHAATVSVTGRANLDANGDKPAVRSEFSRSLATRAGASPGFVELLGKVMARFHGGELEASSEGDSETTLTLRIPLAGRRPRTTVLGGEVDLG